jgi:putative aldouronate transport system substrate-binding protein
MATWYARFSQASNWTPPGEWRSEASVASLANAQKYYTPDNAFVWPADYATDVDATDKVYRAWVYKFITGQATMDQWQQYVDEYNAAGGQHMTDYARTVLK